MKAEREDEDPDVISRGGEVQPCDTKLSHNI